MNTVLTPSGEECEVDSLTQFDRCQVEGVKFGEGGLLVDVAYSGGCEKHCFKLTWDGTLNEGDPEVILNLLHNSNNDLCESYLRKTKLFQLDSLRQAILENYEVSNARLVVKYGIKKSEALVWEL